VSAIELDSARLRQAFAGFPSGVAAVAAVVDGHPLAIVASTFTVGVSLDPPLVSFAVQQTSSTWPRLREAGSFGVSVLGAEHAELCRQLASKNHEDRFVGRPMDEMPSGALVIPSAPLRMWCKTYREVEAGDHQLVLLEVMDVDCDTEGDPLIFHGSAFRRLQVRT
jgi:flavin reductase (DIM6/NTAB) family NADH-FMN oxidoreductase RutF